ncbi:MAG: hydantoinase/oxoprolinase family protein [Ignisphaera sp.]|nr:hydantoinase/oxoprolinase family protein [Ignisphaera sp.]MCX8167674.1 hydantoinase/oxoprolinase family protein [Ignisphaera sp.]MDW8085664.1 hydantoinase/oxoprolinase family protein [Ignisphaera sp.]
MTRYVLGVDVGSTHTDAVIVDESGNFINGAKTITTPDVTTGIITSMRLVLEKSMVDRDEVAAVSFGTTHIINAIVQRRRLGRVGVIRIGAPATRSVEPGLDWPEDLRKAVIAGYTIVRGGHEYTGEHIVELDRDGVVKALNAFREMGVDAVAVTSVFSIVNPEHELFVKERALETIPEIPIVLSYEIGSVGLLERENATILNAAVLKVMQRAITALENALHELGLGHAKMFFAQNDGTVATVEYIARYPIFTVVAPISNSIRGAYVLTRIPNAIVVDTGGTTSNIGVLRRGYPREALEIEISGVRTNIRSPDVIAVGLAGGSIVKVSEGDISVGPESVGYRLIEEGIAWGGNTITATDIALAKGIMMIEDPRCRPELVKSKIDSALVDKVYEKMVKMLEDAIDRVKTSPEPETVILVGGGSAMWPQKLVGAREVIRPEFAQYANAVGAATALIGASVEKAFSYEATPREKAIDMVVDEAKKRAVEAGADPSTLDVAEVEEIAMPYLPGNAVKIRVKVIGKLKL